MNKILYLGVFSTVASLLYQDRGLAIALNFATTPVVKTGETAEIEIVISDLGDGSAPSVGVYGFDVNFDSNILNFSRVTFGDSILGNQLDIGGFTSINEVLEPFPNTVNLSELSIDFPEDLDDFQANSFTLATMTFDAVGQGTSSLSFNNLILGDALGDPLSVVTNTGSVTVEAGSTTSVPESSTTFGLMTLGLLVLGSAVRTKFCQ